MPGIQKLVATAITIAGIFFSIFPATAGDAPWRVAKASGEVWVGSAGAQLASLGDKNLLKPGDNIRTGRNGRVLLVRGEESIVVSPNSAIGIPLESKDGLQTTIAQQAGSILLEVEKRNVQHFEVETPYLAAVVKGTKFRVSVDALGARVNVVRGQVQVADFKSGQTVLVLPGQAAKVFAHGPAGLSLSGRGHFNPIVRGTPRTPGIQAISIPKSGLKGPASKTYAKSAIAGPSKPSLRIGAPLGELKLDFQKVTKGLARGSADVGASPSKGNVWTTQKFGMGVGNADSMAGSSGNSAGGAANGIATSNGNGNGNGNNGANGNAGKNGNGKANGKNKSP